MARSPAAQASEHPFVQHFQQSPVTDHYSVFASSPKMWLQLYQEWPPSTPSRTPKGVPYSFLQQSPSISQGLSWDGFQSRLQPASLKPSSELLEPTTQTSSAAPPSRQAVDVPLCIQRSMTGASPSTTRFGQQFQQKTCVPCTTQPKTNAQLSAKAQLNVKAKPNQQITDFEPAKGT